MTPIRITDPDDPRIAVYRDIRERDLAGRHGLFIAEGKVVLRVLFSARRFEAESVLLLENRVPGMTEVLDMAPPDLPVYVADAEVLDHIAGFHLHRGILAAGRRRPDGALLEMLKPLPEDALVVVLVGVSNHDNVGAIFRNAAAFGADAVLLDTTSCDPLYRKAIRVSVGAALKIPFATASTPEIREALAAEGFDAIGLSPSGKQEMHRMEGGVRSALFLGAEGPGLPPEMLAKLKTARIRMSQDFDSLNVAAASAIALHHFALKRGDRGI
ncbi:MAG: RNA methyltransferase [Rhizobiaceae bacterium]